MFDKGEYTMDKGGLGDLKRDLRVFGNKNRRSDVTGPIRAYKKSIDSYKARQRDSVSLEGNKQDR